MKIGIICITFLTILGAGLDRTESKLDFECTITSSKQVYVLGETPDLSVSIENNRGKDVYLIGSLDGSEAKWRAPYCYFTIENPKKTPLPGMEGCGTLNQLRKQDFKLVRAGEVFDPYSSLDEYGFFGSYQILKKENFKHPGIYKITFHYSSKPAELKFYRGYSEEDDEIENLFKLMPHIELSSNTIEIEIR